MVAGVVLGLPFVNLATAVVFGLYVLRDLVDSFGYIFCVSLFSVKTLYIFIYCFKISVIDWEPCGPH